MIFSSKFRIKQCLIIYMQVNLKKWFDNYCTYKHVFLLFTAIRYPKQILVQFIIRIIKIKFLPQVCAPMRRRPVSPQSTGYWGTERRNVRPRSSRELPDTVYMPRHRRTALSRGPAAAYGRPGRCHCRPAYHRTELGHILTQCNKASYPLLDEGL